MRRLATILVVAVAVLTAVTLPASATHGIGISFAGPVRAGEELVLSCPEGYTLDPEPASFYRDPRGRVPLPGYESVEANRMVLWPSGAGFMSAVWVVPKGARYATAHGNCLPMTSVSLTAACVYDDALGQWVHRLDYSITNASGSDQSGTVYYRIDGGNRQGGWVTAVPANATVSGSFQVPADASVERFAVVEYELTGGQMFDSNQVILPGCP